MNTMMRTSDSGFTLVEALVSTAIAAVALVGLASLLATGAEMQTQSRDSSMATNLAQAQLERLRMTDRAFPERQNGGSLAANVAPYFVVRGQTTIRWTIADGPACGVPTWTGATGAVECAKLVTVVAFTTNEPRASRATIRGMIWR